MSWNETVEGPQSLLQPLAGNGPLLAWDDARNEVERPLSVDVARFTVDREGNPHWS